MELLSEDEFGEIFSFLNFEDLLNLKYLSKSVYKSYLKNIKILKIEKEMKIENLKKYHKLLSLSISNIQDSFDFENIFQFKYLKELIINNLNLKINFENFTKFIKEHQNLNSICLLKPKDLDLIKIIQFFNEMDSEKTLFIDKTIYDKKMIQEKMNSKNIGIILDKYLPNFDFNNIYIHFNINYNLLIEKEFIKRIRVLEQMIHQKKKVNWEIISNKIYLISQEEISNLNFSELVTLNFNFKRLKHLEPFLMKKLKEKDLSKLHLYCYKESLSTIPNYEQHLMDLFIGSSSIFNYQTLIRNFIEWSNRVWDFIKKYPKKCFRYSFLKFNLNDLLLYIKIFNLNINDFVDIIIQNLSKERLSILKHLNIYNLSQDNIENIIKFVIENGVSTPHFEKLFPKCRNQNYDLTNLFENQDDLDFKFSLFKILKYNDKMILEYFQNQSSSMIEKFEDILILKVITKFNYKINDLLSSQDQNILKQHLFQKKKFKIIQSLCNKNELELNDDEKKILINH